MLTDKLRIVRDGKRLYRRVANTERFKFWAEFCSVGAAKRFCMSQPDGTVTSANRLGTSVTYEEE